MFPRTEMLDVIVIDGKARGIVTRNLITGKIESHVADAVVLGTGGYGNVFYLSTNAKGSNCTAIWRAYKRGAALANPCFTQIHPTCIPVSGDYQSKLTLMSESLRNDGRIWVPKKKGDTRPPDQIPEDERDYYLERKYPSFGNLVPRDVASRNAKRSAMKAAASAKAASAFIWISRMPSNGWASRESANATAICSTCMNASPAKIRTTVPMRIYPAIHYTMGGLWVDYNLMTTVPGLYRNRRSQFLRSRRQPARRQRLMQGLADGYFILPYTIGDYLASTQTGKSRRHPRRSSRCRSGS